MQRSLLWVGLVLVGALLAACSPVTPRVTPSPGALTTTPRPSVTPRPTRAPQTPTVTPEPVSRLAVNPEALRGRAVQFWHAWDGPTGAALAKQVAAFNAVNEWGVQVELTYAGILDELADATAAAYPDGEPPDLALAYAYQALGWDEGRAVTDLTPFVDDPIWGLPPEDVNDFYPAAWEAGEVGGRRVGVPLYLDSQVLIYNQGWAKELGFDSPPLTQAQFERQACAAAQANARDDDPTNDGAGGYLATTHYGALLNWIYAGGEPVTAANGRSYRFDSQAVQDTLDFLRSLYDRGCSHLAETQRPQDEFARRRALFFIDELSALPALEDAFRRTGRVEDWAVIPFPPVIGASAWAVYGPQIVVLAESEEDQLASWLFVRWLLQPENHAPLVAAAGTLPARAATLALLEAETPSQAWLQTAERLPSARPEPAFESWKTVRWALQDATTQLYRYYFEIEQVEQLSELLDQTADDLHRSFGR